MPARTVRPASRPVQVLPVRPDVNLADRGHVAGRGDLCRGRVAVGSPARGPADVVRADLDQVDYHNFRHVWDRVIKQAGLAAPKPTFHDLRHTFGTRMAAAGTPSKEIALVMGQASTTTTDLYIHSAGPHVAEAWMRHALQGDISPVESLGRREQAYRPLGKGSVLGTAITHSPSHGRRTPRTRPTWRVAREGDAGLQGQHIAHRQHTIFIPGGGTSVIMPLTCRVMVGTAGFEPTTP